MEMAWTLVGGMQSGKEGGEEEGGCLHWLGERN
jgi:hypothetical protein